MSACSSLCATVGFLSGICDLLLPRLWNSFPCTGSHTLYASILPWRLRRVGAPSLRWHHSLAQRGLCSAKSSLKTLVGQDALRKKKVGFRCWIGKWLHEKLTVEGHFTPATTCHMMTQNTASPDAAGTDVQMFVTYRCSPQRSSNPD